MSKKSTQSPTTKAPITNDQATKKKAIAQKKYFCGIINNQNDRPEFTKKQLEKAFLSLPKSNHFCFILHDKDTLDTGELKRKHFHFTCEVSAKMTEAGFRDALQKSLSSVAGFSVSMDVLTASFCSSMVAYKRYLIHKDESHESGEKYAYQESDVVTNDSSSFESALNGIERCFLTFDQLLSIVKNSTYKSEIFRKIGLENSQRYLQLINALLDEKKARANDEFIKAINHTKLLIDAKSEN